MNWTNIYIFMIKHSKKEERIQEREEKRFINNIYWRSSSFSLKLKKTTQNRESFFVANNIKTIESSRFYRSTMLLNSNLPHIKFKEALTRCLPFYTFIWFRQFIDPSSAMYSRIQEKRWRLSSISLQFSSSRFSH